MWRRSSERVHHHSLSWLDPQLTCNQRGGSDSSRLSILYIFNLKLLIVLIFKDRKHTERSQWTKLVNVDHKILTVIISRSIRFIPMIQVLIEYKKILLIVSKLFFLKRKQSWLDLLWLCIIKNHVFNRLFFEKCSLISIDISNHFKQKAQKLLF